MKLVRGWKPATEVERAFAREKVKLVGKEVAAYHGPAITEPVMTDTATTSRKNAYYHRRYCDRRACAKRRARYFQPGRG